MTQMRKAILDRLMSHNPAAAEGVWICEDYESWKTAKACERELGRLPKRVLRTDVQFNLSETRTYAGQEGQSLVSTACRIIAAAGCKFRFLRALKGVAMDMIEPLKAYMRVHLAITRLEETMVTVYQDIQADCHSGSSPRSRLGRTDRKSQPRFRWRQSPTEIYAFKEMTETYGFDPRDTSVVWIEKRAASLRRQWKAFDARQTHSSPKPPQSQSVKGDHIQVRDFVPVDADYNTIWPPIKLPPAPPSRACKSNQIADHTVWVNSDPYKVDNKGSPAAPSWNLHSKYPEPQTFICEGDQSVGVSSPTLPPNERAPP